MWMTLLFLGTATLFVAMTCAALWRLRWVQRLPLTATTAGRARLVTEHVFRCSVVMAARDEEARIEQTIRHLLAQSGVETELIVVDDRSTDRTSEILQRLAT